MTAGHKAVVQARIREMGTTQAALAAQLGTTPAILSRTLGSALVRQDSHWPALLEALGLEVIIQPKQGTA